MQKTILIISLLAFAAFASVQPRQDDFKALWDAWKVLYSKTYGLEEETIRYQTFVQNYNKILQHNHENHSYKLGLNQFADLTTDEFKSKHLGYLGSIPERTEISEADFIKSSQTLAATLDWRAQGVVSPIRNQGQCGSCWAFSAAEAIESAVAIKTKKLTKLSPQQLVDCTWSYGNEGCNGGWMDNAFDYVQRRGIATEANYPYKAVDQGCKSTTAAVKISYYNNVRSGSTSRLKLAVNKQPISVAVEAQNWQFYKSGIFSDCSDYLDHAVLLVGYTSDAWIIQNQWGSSWGEKGSMRLELGNTCGIADVASYPVL